MASSAFCTRLRTARRSVGACSATTPTVASSVHWSVTPTGSRQRRPFAPPGFEEGSQVLWPPLQAGDAHQREMILHQVGEMPELLLDVAEGLGNDRRTIRRRVLQFLSQDGYLEEDRAQRRR